MRSGVVVLGAVAFGYLSFRVGFKPYLDRAQEAMDSSHDAASASADASGDSGGADRQEEGADLAPSSGPGRRAPRLKACARVKARVSQRASWFRHFDEHLICGS
ncbi:hypothetical protein PR202_gb01926 [Eleusine coracana subsp. coracana]|uniref:Uncharacterized protein n=1 Tax=Eleusine coracana subsp. coracana TaxID=191504 RepID=A0AAV5DYS0_ELECO|nr:hypothetical protein PR202_gb01926 [Eleusine coracana subsp. coracana]